MFSKDFCEYCLSRAGTFSHGLHLCLNCSSRIDNYTFCDGKGLCYIDTDNNFFVSGHTTFVKVPCQHDCQLKECKSCGLWLPEKSVAYCSCQIESFSSDTDDDDILDMEIEDLIQADMARVH